MLGRIRAKNLGVENQKISSPKKIEIEREQFLDFFLKKAEYFKKNLSLSTSIILKKKRCMSPIETKLHFANVGKRKTPCLKFRHYSAKTCMVF